MGTRSDRQPRCDPLTELMASPNEDVTHTSRRIFETSIEMFSRRGYAATSVRDIAGAIGIESSSLYSHYSSKEEILWAISADAITTLESLQDDGVSALVPTDRLREFVRRHVAYHAGNPLQARVVNNSMRSLTAQRWEAVIAFRKRYEERLLRIIDSGLEAGDFNAPDARIVTYAILQMGMAVSEWFDSTRRLDIEAICDLYVEFACRIVGAPLSRDERLAMPDAIGSTAVELGGE